MLRVATCKSYDFEELYRGKVVDPKTGKKVPVGDFCEINGLKNGNSKIGEMNRGFSEDRSQNKAVTCKSYKQTRAGLEIGFDHMQDVVHHDQNADHSSLPRLTRYGDSYIREASSTTLAASMTDVNKNMDSGNASSCTEDFSRKSLEPVEKIIKNSKNFKKEQSSRNGSPVQSIMNTLTRVSSKMSEHSSFSHSKSQKTAQKIGTIKTTKSKTTKSSSVTRTHSISRTCSKNSTKSTTSEGSKISQKSKNKKTKESEKVELKETHSNNSQAKSIASSKISFSELYGSKNYRNKKKDAVTGMTVSVL